MKRWGPIEFFLIQVTIYCLLWVSYEYLAILISSILAPIAFFLLLIAWIAERLDPSRVPRWYFQLMVASVLAPVVVAVIFYWIGEVV